MNQREDIMAVSIGILINYRNRKNKKGLYPIHIRVTIDNNPQYYLVDLPVKVSMKDWTGNDLFWVAETNPYNLEINEAINQMRTKIIDLHRSLYSQKRKFSFYHIDKVLGFKGNGEIFNDYFKNYMRKPPPTVVITDVTWEKYDAFMKHLDKFNPALRFDEIDWEMVARIRNYLAEQRGRKGDLLAPATIKSYFDKFKVVLEYAAKRDGMLDVKQVESFFEDVKISVPDKEEGLHLEITEIQAFKKVVTDKQYPVQKRDQKLFLFQIYTGYYYNDLKTLKRKHVRRDFEHGYYIIGERDKNGNATIIPLWKFPDGVATLEEFMDPNTESEYWFRRNIFVDPQVYNRNVKVIAKAAGIKREISNKIARHTNIQMWIRLGAKRPVVSKMAGHEKEATTENYYKVNIAEVIAGTENVSFTALGI
ncbi:site-specific integrase [Niabella ginsenosidivorans]|nr:site-specific integrase [Niabella ginsenosidivorans]